MGNLTFQVESWYDCVKEMAQLWPMHWEEVAQTKDKVPLDVHFEAYELMVQTGELLVLTARHQGVLVGYYWGIIRPHLHYKSTLHGFTDLFFLHKDFRMGMNGLLLIKAYEEAMRARGVKKLFAASKLLHDKTPIFQRLGWTPVETVYSKWIGG